MMLIGAWIPGMTPILPWIAWSIFGAICLGLVWFAWKTRKL